MTAGPDAARAPFLRRAAELLARVDPKLAAVVGIAAVAAAGVLGVLHLQNEETRPGLSTGFVDLDGERTLVTLLTGAALLAAAAGAIVLSGRVTAAGRRLRVLGGFFAFMALDEGFAFHEKLETAAGVTWEVLYLPVFVVGAVAAVAVLLALRQLPPAHVLLAAGALAWAAATVLEDIQWDSADRPVAAYDTLMVIEELAELTGSLVWALAFLVATRRALRAEPTPVPGAGPGAVRASD